MNTNPSETNPRVTATLTDNGTVPTQTDLSMLNLMQNLSAQITGMRKEAKANTSKLELSLKKSQAENKTEIKKFRDDLKSYESSMSRKIDEITTRQNKLEAELKALKESPAGHLPNDTSDTAALAETKTKIKRLEDLIHQ